MSEVFISYRRENDAHCTRVRQLAGRLEDEGIRVVLDEFADEREFHYGGPPRGWDLWSIQMATDSPSVLIVGSPGWFRVINNPAPTDTGKGAAAEAETIVHRLYRNSGYNNFASIGFFDAENDLADLPPYLDKCGRFDLSDQGRIPALLTWLRRPITPVVFPSAVITPAALTPAVPAIATQSGFPDKLPSVDRAGFLDCSDVFLAFERLLNPDNRKRVLLLEAEGEHGKTDLTARFFAHAQDVVSSNSAAFIRFQPPVREPGRFVDFLYDALQPPVPAAGS